MRCLGAAKASSSNNQFVFQKIKKKFPFRGLDRSALGFSVVELVFVVLVTSALFAYVVPKATDPTAFTLKSQAERFSGDLRSARFASLVGNVKLCVKLGADSYGIFEVEENAGTDRCSSTQWKDPVTNMPVGFSLVHGATLRASKGATEMSPLIFQRLGIPSVASEYELTGGGVTLKVSVTEFTGYVSISQ